MGFDDRLVDDDSNCDRCDSDSNRFLNANGICYDLENSPYTFTRLGFVFHFSSPLHLKKFKDNYSAKEQWAVDSLSRRFRCGFDARLLADFQLYSKIETRGFYVFDSVKERRYSEWRQVHLSLEPRD